MLGDNWGYAGYVNLMHDLAFPDENIPKPGALTEKGYMRAYHTITMERFSLNTEVRVEVMQALKIRWRFYVRR